MDDKALMLQSLKATSLLLDGAEKIIDLKHGKGYADAHAELVGHFMLTAVLDMHARTHAQLIGKLAESLGI